MAGLLLIVFIAGMAAWRAGWLDFGGQTLPGRLTEYYKTYDRFWELVCDSALDGSDRRCYAQYVEAYRFRPDFAAAMVEVIYRPGDDGRADPHVRFDIEPGLSFGDASVTVETPDGGLLVDVSGCRSNTCVFSGEAGRTILQSWRRGSSMHLKIDEGRAEPVELAWPLGEMDALLDDLGRQRAERDLP